MTIRGFFRWLATDGEVANNLDQVRKSLEDVFERRQQFDRINQKANILALEGKHDTWAYHIHRKTMDGLVDYMEQQLSKNQQLLDHNRKIIDSWNKR